MTTQHDALLAACDAAASAHERFKNHGRIAGDDVLLYNYGLVATPSAVAAGIRAQAKEIENWQYYTELAVKEGRNQMARAEAAEAKLADEINEHKQTAVAYQAALNENKIANRHTLELKTKLAKVEAETIKRCAKVLNEMADAEEDKYPDDPSTYISLREGAAAIRALPRVAAVQEAGNKPSSQYANGLEQAAEKNADMLAQEAERDEAK